MEDSTVSYFKMVPGVVLNPILLMVCKCLAVLSVAFKRPFLYNKEHVFYAENVCLGKWSFPL